MGQNSANANAANVNAINSNPTNANSIAQNTSQASNAPGSQAYGGVSDGSGASGGPATQTAGNPSMATTGSGSPMGYGSSVGPDGTANVENMSRTMQSPSDYWNKFTENIDQWWTNQDKYQKNGYMQMGAGLMQGIGQGALSMMSESKKQALLQQQYNDQKANMSGAAMPTVGFKPSTQNPYKAAGLINSAKA
jgi:hypothetical protein